MKGVKDGSETWGPEETGGFWKENGSGSKTGAGDPCLNGDHRSGKNHIYPGIRRGSGESANL